MELNNQNKLKKYYIFIKLILSFNIIYKKNVFAINIK